MKKIIRNTAAIMALTIGASQAKAQLASDAPSPAFKAAPAPVAKPAAEVQTASSSSSVSVSAKATLTTTVAQPSQGTVEMPSVSSGKAAVPARALPMQEGQQPKPEEVRQPAKAALPSQG